MTNDKVMNNGEKKSDNGARRRGKNPRETTKQHTRATRHTPAPSSAPETAKQQIVGIYGQIFDQTRDFDMHSRTVL